MSQDLSDSAPILVADIGGTNARFAVARRLDGRMCIEQPADYACADFRSLDEITARYLSGLPQPPARAAMAVAGPVRDGAVHMTNLGWEISERGLLAAHGFQQLRLINDFSAFAYAAPHLGADDLVRLGPERAGTPSGTLLVVGPGTGFGVAARVRDGHRESVLASEAGHMAFAPQDELEIEILRHLQRRFGRVSNERLLCGPGLLNLHQALCDIEGGVSEAVEPADITLGGQRGDPACLRTLMRFCGMLGSVAGDLALAFGAEAGVFLAGGIAPKIRPWLESGSFRARFEAKGRLSALTQRIPTDLVTQPKAALLGIAWAGQALSQRP